jgi:hypothetical protein
MVVILVTNITKMERIELHATPKEDHVEVMFKQGKRTIVYSVDDKLFQESKLPKEARNIHAVIETLIQEFEYSVDTTKPRKKELLKFLAYLSFRSPELKNFSYALSKYFMDEIILLLTVYTFVLFLIAIVIFLVLK